LNDYGIDVDEIRESFVRYMARFGTGLEPDLNRGEPHATMRPGTELSTEPAD